jgi:hypothetical protein
MKKIIVFSCIAILFSCASTASYQRATSGKIGCAPDDIEITQNTRDAWTATCKGHRFFCSVTGKSGKYSSGFTCTPEIK